MLMQLYLNKKHFYLIYLYYLYVVMNKGYQKLFLIFGLCFYKMIQFLFSHFLIFLDFLFYIHQFIYIFLLLHQLLIHIVLFFGFER